MTAPAIGHRLADSGWHGGPGESTRRHQDRVLAEDIDRRADRGLRAVQLGRRHQKLGDVGLQLFVGGAVFGVAEPAEARRAVVDGDLLAAKVTVGDLAIVQTCQAISTRWVTAPSSVQSLMRAAGRGSVRVQRPSAVERRPSPGSRCSRHRRRRSRWPSARDAQRPAAWRPVAERFRCCAAAANARTGAEIHHCADSGRTSRRWPTTPGL